ncbi:preprotein translocase subunit SecG [Rhodobacter veldkampii DSM 11550]|uniref:Protein-export membrane protein SecG n=1 Tax=Phaeovulum veldkampii DSM 11550 TaxID=1185920 RepID=A0A2T4JN64_9RHOB|nr:preprotein translocase subunit SecG [Phaeovulum veldkampii]MBK5947659.1 preprotein translocase subunit SecG [Phaeovulum veldkampii DSM 11550]PTE19338.1 preprotein translocase subunit SecG [Phaeovulum veldkampii DSM 11550]TDQ62165.1 preprotein translocase subunit SecG [Phaeovulum veldkampii DSM 11550]
MENIILTVHLILALLLIGVVLLQRSEGGGLGMGGGGVVSGRAAANALSRLTWIFAIAFIATSLALTVVAARKASTGSVVDLPGAEAPLAPLVPALPEVELPPAPTDAPLAPPPVE